MLLLLLFLPLLLASPSAPTVLVYSRTAGFRHDSIPTAIDQLRSLAPRTTPPFIPTFSEDPALFTPSGLAPFDVILFLSNSDEVLDDAGKAALQGWLEGNGNSTTGEKRKRGLVGIHSATACLFTTQSFGSAFGAWFDYHPPLQQVTFLPLASHPTTAMFPARYTILEEAYQFKSDPRSTNATVLMTVDPSSYQDPMRGTRGFYQGVNIPSAWYREGTVQLGNGTAPGGTMEGRMWYTSLGHTNETWRDAVFLAHVQAGIQWVMDGIFVVVATSPTISSTTSASTSSQTRPTSAISSSASTAISTATTRPTSGVSRDSYGWALLVGACLVAAIA